MAHISKAPMGRSLLLYTYEYEHRGTLVKVNAFWENVREVRSEIRAQRSVLLQQARDRMLPDMRIMEIETIPMDEKAVVQLLNDEHESLDFFVRSRTLIEIVSIP